MSLFQNQTAPLQQNLEKTILAKSDLQPYIENLQLWNSLTFAFKSQVMRIYFNGNKVAETSTKYSFINNQAPFCYIGNSQDLKDPFHGHIRHLVFSKEGFDQTTIQTKIRSTILPSDQNILAYFQFQKEFTNFETYYYNQTRKYIFSNVVSGSTNEPESVCYCTTTPQSILRIANNLLLKPLQFNSSIQSCSVDQTGITLNIQIMAIRQDSPEIDQKLVSVVNYADVVLTNNSQSIRVDLYNQNSSTTSFIFKKYRFKFQYWTKYSIVITSNSLSLIIDGIETEKLTHTIVLPKNANYVQIQQPQSINYLLYQLSVQDSKQRACLNQTFTKSGLPSGFQKNNVTTGVLNFETNNQICSLTDTASPSQFIASSGNTCKDGRLYAQFGSSINKVPAKQTSLTGMFKSTSNKMTIEFWMKDVKTPNISDAVSVILENAEGSILATQIAIITNTSNINQRHLRVTPLISQLPGQYIEWKTLNRTQNNWIHFSVVSNITQMRLIIYNQTSKATQTIFQDSLAFFTSQNELNTSLGSSITGLNKFNGFIRELRIWSSVRTDSELALFRQSSSLQIGNSLLNYFMLNSGNEIYTIYDIRGSQTKYFSEKSVDIPSISWVQDKELVICRPGLFFNGICCQQVNLTGIDFKTSYLSTRSVIQTQIVNTTLVHENLMKSIYANFTVLSIGNSDYPNATNSSIQKLFSVNQSQGFNVSSLQINPAAYNVTIQAKIYSVYGPQIQIMNKTLTFLCPNFFLQINNASLDFASEQRFLVSTQADSSLTLELRSVQNSSTSYCYNPKTKQIENVTVNQRTWSQVLSVPNTSLLFPNIWNQSADNSSIQFKGVSMAGQKWNKVTAKIVYNTIQILESSVNLTYIQVWTVNPDFPNSTFMRNYQMSQQVKIDFSKTVSSDPANYPDLTYDVACPLSIFTSTSQYFQLCKMSGSSFSLSPSSLRITQFKKYLFIFYIGIKGTNIIRQINSNVTFYQDSSFGSCPNFALPQNLQYNKLTGNGLNISAQPYFACGGTFYEPLSIEWSVIDAVTGKTVLQLLSISSNQYNVSIFQDNAALKKIMSGTKLMIQVKQLTAVQNISSYIVPSKQVNVTSSTYLTIIKNPLVPKIKIINNQQQPLDPQNISFLEAKFTLSAIESYDPDNSTAILAFSWSCPSEIQVTDCNIMATGTRNNNLEFPIIEKFKADLKYGQNYTFTVTLSSVDNIYAQNVSLDFNISFALPSKDDIIPNELANSECETLTIESQSFTEIDGAQTIVFEKNNWDQHIITTTAMLDNNQDSSECGYGQPQYQYLILYLFDGLAGTTDPFRYLVIQNNGDVLKLVTNTIESSEFPILKSFIANQPIQATFYLFTQRSEKTFVNMQKIFFQRKFSALVAIVKPEQMQLDQFLTMALNASMSYDQEDSTIHNFTYMWECPPSEETVESCNTQGPILKLTYRDRVALDTNQAFQTYEYKVKIMIDGRESEQTSAFVTITQRADYDDCIQITDSVSFQPYSYDFVKQNRTIFVDTNQMISFTIGATAKAVCESGIIISSTWLNFNNPNVKFWTENPSNKSSIFVNSNTLSQLVSGSLNTIIFSSTLQLADDPNLIFKKKSYFNINMNPPLLTPSITGKQIVSPFTEKQLVLNASNSHDPMNLPYQCMWDCPEELGGRICATGCVYNQKYSYLQSLLNRNISYLFDAALPFNVTITSVDKQRVTKQTAYIYMVDQTNASSPFNEQGIQNCSIKLFGQSDTQLFKMVSQQNVFYFGCESENLTSYILSTTFFQLNWIVDGLQSQADYYIQNNQLFIKPYALAKLPMVNKIQIAVIIKALNTTSNVTQKRVLQDWSDWTPESSNQDQDPNSSSQDPSDNSNAIDSPPTDPNADSGSNQNPDSKENTDPPINENSSNESPPTDSPSDPEQPSNDGQPEQPAQNPEPETPPTDNPDNNETPNSSDPNDQPQDNTNNSDTQNTDSDSTNIPNESTESHENTTNPESNNTGSNSTNSNSTDSQSNQTQSDNSTNSQQNQTVNNTHSDENQQSNNSTQTPPSQDDDYLGSVARKYDDRSLKSEFWFKRDILQLGKVVPVPRGPSMEAYTSNYSFTFSGFYTSPPAAILFQLRAVQSEIYNASSIIVPLKLFAKETADIYYNQTYLPKCSQLWLDFFDANLNYLGSQNLREVGNPLEFFNRMGSMTYNQVDKILNSIQSKSLTGYLDEDTATTEFELDMKRMLEMAEFIYLDGVPGLFDTLIDNYVQKIVSYLKINFKAMIQKYDVTNFYERRSKLINQKRAILIIYNLLRKSVGINSLVIQVLDVFDSSTSEFETLVYNSGEDAMFLRSVILYIQDKLKIHLKNTNLSNKNFYFDKIYNITDKVYLTDISKTTNSNAPKLQQITSNNQSRSIYKLNGNSLEKIMLSNANNPRENVSFSGTEGDLLKSMNVSTLSVQYDTFDPSLASTKYNISSLSLITIKAFDVNGSMVAVNFTQNQSYFEMSMMISEAAKKNISLQNKTKPKYKLQCMYFDERRYEWSNQGVIMDSYDNETGTVICQTYHLSQYSVQTVPSNTSSPPPPPPPTPPSNNQTNNSTANNSTIGKNQTSNSTNNSTQTTNQTNSTKEPEPKQNMTTSRFSSYFYIANDTNYLAAVIIISAIYCLSIVVSFCCCTYRPQTKKGENLSDQVPLKPPETNVRHLIWAVFKVYHPLISSIFAQVNPVMAIPRYFQLFSLFIYLFAVTLFSLIHMVYIAQSQSDYYLNQNIVIIYAAIYLGVAFLIRPLFNRIKYGMYFQYSSINEINQASTKEITDCQHLDSANKEFTLAPGQLILQNRAEKYKMNGHGKNPSEEELHYQLEGGESEDEIDDTLKKVPNPQNKQRATPGVNSREYETRNNQTNSASFEFHSQSYLTANQPTNWQKAQHIEEEAKLDTSSWKEEGSRINTQRREQKKIDINIACQGTPQMTEEQEFEEDFSSNFVHPDQIQVDLEQNGEGPPSQLSISPPKTAVTRMDVTAYTAQRIQEGSTQRDTLHRINENKNPPEEQRNKNKSLDSNHNKAKLNKVLTIENSYALKGTRVCLLLLLALISIGELIACFSIMRQVQDAESLQAWISTSVAMCCIYILGIDTCLGIIFALMFSKCRETEEGIKAGWLSCFGGLLVGNLDWRARLSVSLEIQGYNK